MARYVSRNGKRFPLPEIPCSAEGCGASRHTEIATASLRSGRSNCIVTLSLFRCRRSDLRSRSPWGNHLRGSAVLEGRKPPRHYPNRQNCRDGSVGFSSHLVFSSTSSRNTFLIRSRNGAPPLARVSSFVLRSYGPETSTP